MHFYYTWIIFLLFSELIADSGERLLGNKKTNVADEVKNKQEEASKNKLFQYLYIWRI